MSNFSFLPLSERKGIPEPKVFLESSNTHYGGYYSIEHKHIVVCETPDIASTLAHEYRHYLQDYTNIVKLPKTNNSPNFNLPYRKMIRHYYRTKRHELDALLYELKHAKTEIAYWWYKHLVIPERLPNHD